MAKMQSGRKLIIGDTTLRDGVQMAGARLPPGARIQIARALEEAGVRSIEVGFPAIGPHEVEEIRAVAAQTQSAMLTVLSRAKSEDIDAACAAFAGVPRYRCGVNLFLATSSIHRERRLRKSKEEILAKVDSAVRYARGHFRFVSFGAEDAGRTDFEFLCDVYAAAIDAGVSTIGFPDTVGILQPQQVHRTIGALRARLAQHPVRIAVHFHNDLGLATANTLAAIEAGADVAQCTVNGIGERAGNAALEEVVLALALAEEGRPTGIDTRRLAALSRMVAQHTGVPVSPHKPVVGERVFTTAAGMHQEGLLRDVKSFQPFAPSLVGGAGVTLSLGRLSGHAAVSEYLRQAGREPTVDAVEEMLRRLRDPERDHERVEVTLHDEAR